jgi:hypothetical protein
MGAGASGAAGSDSSTGGGSTGGEESSCARDPATQNRSPNPLTKVMVLRKRLIDP